MRPLLLLLPFTLCAADLQVSDLRIEIGRGEVSGYEATYRYKQGSDSMFATQTLTVDEYDGDAPFAISALYSRGLLDPVGFVWAAGVEYQGSSDDIDGESYDTALIGAKVRGGIGWTPAPLWRIEATAEGHLGHMRVDDADMTSNGDLDRATADGAYTALGLQIGAGYAIKGKWELGVSLRALWYSASTEADFDQTGGSYEADITWTYLSAAITGGYRF